jgi:3-methyladenine DNA glycosylase/8-oxoguanine DNA glycosylase
MAKTFIYKTVNQAHINELFKLEPLLQRYLNINTPITFRLMPDHYKCLIHSIISQQLNSAAVDAI